MQATELIAIHELDQMRQDRARILTAATLLEQQTITLSLEPEVRPIHRAEILFLTPTELKGTGQILGSPVFGVLFARGRD